MYKYLFFAIACLCTQNLNAQILNESFENYSNYWDLQITKNQTFTLDSTFKIGGKSSLKISGALTTVKDYLPFYQKINLQTTDLQTLKISAYIKTANLTGTAALLCLLLDKNGNRIGFQNSEMQNLIVNGNTDWKKYSLAITLNKDVSTLIIGGYVSGDGDAWFDDFSLENGKVENNEVLKFTEEIKGLVKQHSIYTDSLNWSKIDTEIKKIAAGLSNINEAQVIGDYLIKELRKVGDNHSFMQSKIKTKNYTLVNSTPEKPKSSIIDEKIGYIYVPGFTSTNNTISFQFADTIQNLIKSIDTKYKLKRWIVDLRDNKGGNMYPMIAGLAPLIGEGTLGYFVSLKEKKEVYEEWYYKNGKIGLGKNYVSLSLETPYSIKNKNSKIAILISPKTSSSGEMTAISFIGNNNVKIFGQPSGGFTTGNITYPLSNGTSLVLAATYITDRMKKKYLKGLTPDVIINPDDTAKTLNAAILWLFKK